jgi:hypothetical protein
MRATRAYVAGFGTAGSVLACAAVLFVIASAVVAFRGWPKIAVQQSPAALRLDAPPVAGSRVARRLRAVVGAAAPAVAAPLIHAAARPAAGGRTAPPSAHASLQRPSSRATTLTVPAGPPTTETVPAAPAGMGVKPVANSAGNAVAQTGAEAGAAVGGAPATP